MSEELHDFRGKFTKRTHQVLSAKAMATGRDMAEIVREVMGKWADDELHALTVMQRILRSEGSDADSRGNV